jgi:hypothetical protein
MVIEDLRGHDSILHKGVTGGGLGSDRDPRTLADILEQG